MSYRAGILTLSDKGSRGRREDLSGAAVERILRDAGYEIVYRNLLSDDRAPMERELARLCDEGVCDLLLTTGGTGFSPRDVTPEATRSIGERDVPGIAEAMRAFSMRITPRGMLSRAVSVIRKGTLIVNLPGSPRAVEENLTYILPSLSHGLGILTGRESECGNAAEKGKGADGNEG